MIRKEAVEIITKNFKETIIVSANGFISRDLYEICDKESNFYMIGSMGLASSIGLGIALKNPKRKIFIFDGDGNILMNLGSIVTIGSLQPKNFFHIVFDNQSHESTGSQPTNSSKVDLEKLAKNSNYTTFSTKSKKELIIILNKIKNIQGPVFVLVKIKNSKIKSKRVNHTPKTIRNNLMKVLEIK